MLNLSGALCVHDNEQGLERSIVALCHKVGLGVPGLFGLFDCCIGAGQPVSEIERSRFVTLARAA